MQDKILPALAALLLCLGVVEAQVPAFPGGGPPPGAGGPPGGFPGGPPPGAGGVGTPVGVGGPAGAGEPSEEFKEFFLKMQFPDLPADAAKPSADPKDLRGTYSYTDHPLQQFSSTMYGRKIPLTPKAKQIVDKRVALDRAGHPVASASDRCIEPGQVWQLVLGKPFQFFQTKDMVYVFFQEFHGVWKIHLTDKPVRSANPEYMGDSVGHWDGNTLVVETTNYKAPLWLDIKGTPATTQLKMTNRIRKINQEGIHGLEIITTFEDPEMFTAPWSIVRRYAWRPDKMLFDEYNCERQSGESDGLSRYGVSEE